MKLQLRNEKIVVSLTTTPHRIDKIKPTLDSIMTQNASIQNIYLSIPHKFIRDNLEYQIPEWLSNQQQIKILRTEDYGPGTKLLGLLEQTDLADYTIIITVDDDIIYPNNHILHLAYAAHKNPQIAVSPMGATPASNTIFGLRRISENNTEVKILQGWSGIAYRRNFFADDIFAINETIPECKNSDDIYFSFYLAKNNIPRLVLRDKYMSAELINHRTKIGHDEHALYKQDSPAEKHKACIAYLQATNPMVNF